MIKRATLLKCWTAILLGIAFALIGLFFMKIPPTFRRVNVIEFYLTKYFIMIVGFMLILFGISYYISKGARIRDFLSNTLISFFTIIVCILAIEIFLQLNSSRGCRQVDDILDHSYIPNCSSRFRAPEWDIDIRINSIGIRDKEIDIRDDYPYRILMLGDSFLMGYGVSEDERFSNLVEEELIADGYVVDVVNAGITSYSPLLEYLYLREKGLHLQPDMVILFFDMGDTQNDNEYEKRALKSDGKVISVPGAQERNFLIEIYNRIMVTKLFEIPIVALDSRLPNDIIFGKEQFYNLKYDRYAVTRLNITEKQEVEYWNLSLRNLRWINELCEMNNITFILAAYPYGHQISGEEWALGRHNFGFEPGKIYSERPDHILREFSKEEEIIYISLFEGFKASDAFPLYFPYDGHFNQEGHRLAADILVDELTSRDILGTN